MKIGIIGAGIAGLAAGRELSRAGHEVTVIERNRVVGGRLLTARIGEEGKTVADVGVSTLHSSTPVFRPFAAELLDKKLLNVWGDNVIRHDGEKFLDSPPESTSGVTYCAPDGMDRIAGHLSRWVDLMTGEKAGGLTYFGANRTRKRPWMINLSSFNTFEADAVIVATPAPEAYGILLTTKDEVNVLKIIREIDEINYDPVHALVVGYGDRQAPNWDSVHCLNSAVASITHENSKRELPERVLVIRSSGEFARENRHEDRELVTSRLLEAAEPIIGNWVSNPVNSYLHYWNFSRPKSVIDRTFMEFESDDAPLAVVGDYFQGNDYEHSFCSGLELARQWIDRFGS